MGRDIVKPLAVLLAFLVAFMPSVIVYADQLPAQLQLPMQSFNMSINNLKSILNARAPDRQANAGDVKELYKFLMQSERIEKMARDLYSTGMLADYIRNARLLRQLSVVKASDLMWFADKKPVCFVHDSTCITDVYYEYTDKPAEYVLMAQLHAIDGGSDRADGNTGVVSRAQENPSAVEDWLSNVLSDYENYGIGSWHNYIETEDIDITSGHKIPVSASTVQNAWQIYGGGIRDTAAKIFGEDFAQSLDKFVAGEDVTSIILDQLDKTLGLNGIKKKINDVFVAMLGQAISPRLAKQIANWIWDQFICLIKAHLPTFDIYDLFQGQSITVYTPCNTYTVEPDKVMFDFIVQYTKRKPNDIKSAKLKSPIVETAAKCAGKGKDMDAGCSRFVRYFLEGRADEIHGQMSAGTLSDKKWEQVQKEHAQMISAMSELPVNVVANDDEEADSLLGKVLGEILGEGGGKVPYARNLDGMTLMTGLKAAGDLQLMFEGKEFLKAIDPSLRGVYAHYAVAQSARNAYIRGKLARIQEYRRQIGFASSQMGSMCTTGLYEWCDTIDEGLLHMAVSMLEGSTIGTNVISNNFPLCETLYSAATKVLDLIPGLDLGTPTYADLFPPGLVSFIRKVILTQGEGGDGEVRRMLADMKQKYKQFGINLDVDTMAKLVVAQEKTFASMSCPVPDTARIMAYTSLLQEDSLMDAGNDTILAFGNGGIEPRAACCGVCAKALAAANKAAMIAAAINTWLKTVLYTFLTTTLVLTIAAAASYIGYQLCLTRWVIRNEFRWFKKWYAVQMCLQMKLAAQQIVTQLEVLEVDTLILASLYADKTRREVDHWQSLIHTYESQGLSPFTFEYSSTGGNNEGK